MIHITIFSDIWGNNHYRKPNPLRRNPSHVPTSYSSPLYPHLDQSCTKQSLQQVHRWIPSTTRLPLRDQSLMSTSRWLIRGQSKVWAPFGWSLAADLSRSRPAMHFHLVDNSRWPIPRSRLWCCWKGGNPAQSKSRQPSGQGKQLNPFHGLESFRLRLETRGICPPASLCDVGLDTVCTKWPVYIGICVSVFIFYSPTQSWLPEGIHEKN